MSRATDAPIRSFVAIELDGDARRALCAYLERLRPVEGVAWTPPENLHVTLKFLGNVAPRRLDSLAARLVTVAAARAPFVISCAGVGAFPSLARPRILWAGVRAPELDALAGAVDGACAADGFPGEEKPFHAHCTLGRLRASARRRVDRAAVSRVLEALGVADAHSFGTSPASALVLFRSDTDARGARYTALGTFSFTAHA